MLVRTAIIPALAVPPAIREPSAVTTAASEFAPPGTNAVAVFWINTAFVSIVHAVPAAPTNATPLAAAATVRASTLIAKVDVLVTVVVSLIVVKKRPKLAAAALPNIDACAVFNTTVSRAVWFAVAVIVVAPGVLRAVPAVPTNTLLTPRPKVIAFTLAPPPTQMLLAPVVDVKVTVLVPVAPLKIKLIGELSVLVTTLTPAVDASVKPVMVNPLPAAAAVTVRKPAGATPAIVTPCGKVIVAAEVVEPAATEIVPVEELTKVSPVVLPEANAEITNAPAPELVIVLVTAPAPLKPTLVMVTLPEPLSVIPTAVAKESVKDPMVNSAAPEFVRVTVANALSTQVEPVRLSAPAAESVTVKAAFDIVPVIVTVEALVDAPVEVIVRPAALVLVIAAVFELPAPLEVRATVVNALDVKTLEAKVKAAVPVLLRVRVVKLLSVDAAPVKINALVELSLMVIVFAPVVKPATVDVIVAEAVPVAVLESLITNG